MLCAFLFRPIYFGGNLSDQGESCTNAVYLCIEDLREKQKNICGTQFADWSMHLGGAEFRNIKKKTRPCSVLHRGQPCSPAAALGVKSRKIAHRCSRCSCRQLSPCRSVILKLSHQGRLKPSDDLTCKKSSSTVLFPPIGATARNRTSSFYHESHREQGRSVSPRACCAQHPMTQTSLDVDFNPQTGSFAVHDTYNTILTVLSSSFRLISDFYTRFL